MLFNVYEWHFGCLVALHSRHSAAPYQEMSKAFLQIVERNHYPSGEKKNYRIAVGQHHKQLRYPRDSDVSNEYWVLFTREITRKRMSDMKMKLIGSVG